MNGNSSLSRSPLVILPVVGNLLMLIAGGAYAYHNTKFSDAYLSKMYKGGLGAFAGGLVLTIVAAYYNLQ